MSAAEVELQNIKLNATIDTLLVQCMMDMSPESHADPTLQAGHALAASLKAQLRVAYALSDASDGKLTEANVEYYVQIIDLMADTPAFGACALAGIQDMEATLDDVTDIINGKAMQTDAPFDDGIPDVPVQGYAGVYADCPDIGAGYINIKNALWVGRRLLAAGLMTPGLHGVVRDLFLPIMDFIDFVVMVTDSIEAEEFRAIERSTANSAERARQKMWLIVERGAEIISADPVRYGVQFVATALRAVLRFLCFPPAPSLGAVWRSAGTQAQAGVGQLVLRGSPESAAASLGSMYPSAEAVLFKRWHDGYMGNMAPGSFRVAHIAQWVVGPVGWSAPSIGDAMGNALQGLAAYFGLSSTAAVELATHVNSVLEREDNIFVVSIINFCLFVAQYGLEMLRQSSGGEAKPAAKGTNQSLIEKITRDLDKKAHRYSPDQIVNGAAPDNAAFENQQFDERYDAINAALQAVGDVNDAIVRGMVHRQKRLEAIRTDLKELETLVRRVGKMWGPFTPRQSALLRYIIAGARWYGDANWDPTSARPDDYDEEAGLGLGPLRAQDDEEDEEDEDDEDDEEDEDAPADRSGSIVDQVFAAHAMRRALERKQR
jgi:hypothetical protein